ncbi:MAG: hypothetical protein Q4F24_17810, partial [Eubacteriales bacterium]|nr:hypothetical protein [Eubacteriales bacterium]
GNEIWYDFYPWDDTTGESITENIFDLTKGTYYLVIEKRNDCTGNYSFKLALPHTHSYQNYITKATTSKNGKIVRKCSCGAVAGTTNIYYPKTITLSTTNYTYNGYVKKPSVKVVGSDGNIIDPDNYTVTYASGRKYIGRYRVKVTFKGNYTGSKAVYFEIGPKNPTTVSTSLYGYDDVKVSWSRVSGATGYKVYYKKSTSSSYTYLGRTTGTYYKKANLTDGAKYYFKVVTYKTVDENQCENAGKTGSIYTLKKISAPGVSRYETKVKVRWKNISGESGYQISRSTSSTGTDIVSTYKTTSGTYRYVPATKGKYYYYKVRAYRTVGKKKIYGPWSNAVRYRR